MPLAGAETMVKVIPPLSASVTFKSPLMTPPADCAFRVGDAVGVWLKKNARIGLTGAANAALDAARVVTNWLVETPAAATRDALGRRTAAYIAQPIADSVGTPLPVRSDGGATAAVSTTDDAVEFAGESTVTEVSITAAPVTATALTEDAATCAGGAELMVPVGTRTR